MALLAVHCAGAGQGHRPAAPPPSAATPPPAPAAATSAPPGLPIDPGPPPGAQGPPIPREVLFAAPAVAAVMLSPDGRWVAYRTGSALRVRGVDAAPDGTPGEVSVALPGGALAGGFAWSGDGRLLVLAGGSGGITLHATDPVTQAVGTGARLRPRPLRSLGEGTVAFHPAVPVPPGGALLEAATGDGCRLLRVDLAGGEPAVVAAAGPEVDGWVVDAAGEARAAALRAAGGGTELWTVVLGRLGRRVFACPPGEICRPLALHPDGRRLLVASDRGRQGPGLSLLDPDTGELRPVEASPPAVVTPPVADRASAPDLVAALLAGSGGASAGGVPGWRDELPGVGRVVLGGAVDGGRRLLEVEGPATPGRVLLLDPAAGTVRELFRRRPWLEPTRLVRAAEVHYPARDGRVVPALLIHRRGPGAVPAPAVVVPPREPWEPDPWGFDPLAQLLADRGYAVLQPAPRGSAGWGRHHLEAGRGQWGAGMLDDLADGVRWLIEQGIADPDRVAIVGAGWGGYAAVASLAFTPDLYAAGVAVGGPVDLVAFVEAVPDADHRRRGLLRRLVGDPMDPVQRERLRRQSPLGFAGAIRAPLLRVERQGEGAMGGDRLVAVLEGLGRPLQALTVAGGRGRLEGSEGVAVAAAVEGFLGAHLGGRVERAGLRPAGAAP